MDGANEGGRGVDAPGARPWGGAVCTVARVVLLALVAMLSACRCQPQPAEGVARLVALQGQASKELNAKRGAWSDVAVGASFAVGDALRTQAGTTARVEMSKGGGLSLSERTTVRFLDGEAVKRRLVVEMGEAEIEPGASGINIETLIGMAELEPGSRVRVSAGGTMDVLIGEAELEATDARAGRSVKAGQRLRFSIGSAELEGIERPARPDAETPDARASADAARDAPPAVEGIVAEVHGAGIRASPSAGAALASLAEGTARVAEGSRLVVPAGASVDLSRGDEHVSVLGGSDVELGTVAEGLVRLASGRLTVRSTRPASRTRVPGGYVELVTVGTGEVQADIRVERKAARVLSNHGELLLHGDVRAATVGPGQSGTLDARGAATVDEVLATTADVAIGAGESATVHSAKGVAAIRIPRSDCPADTLIEVTSRGAVRRAFGRADDASTGIFRLVAGSYDYAASCVGGADLQRGTVRVLADSGVAHVATSAATNVVDADGRHYHVLYQGRLPRMTFRWPGAPADGAIVLHTVTASAGERTFPATRAQAELKEGAMPEGAYRYWFDVQGHPDRRSPETSLVIGFDNAAPAAEIRAPADGQPLTPTVHVTGVAGEGATVSVSGVVLPLDAQWRFDGDVPGPPVDNRVLSVRIAHPVRGVHYYVRTFSAP